MDREGLLEYVRGKRQAIREAGQERFTEMGEVAAYGDTQPCATLTQPTKTDRVALMLATVKGSALKRLDLCIIPPFERARRTGEYPR